MPIFRAAILDLSGQVIIPDVSIFIVDNQEHSVEAAFQVAAAVAERLATYGQYQIAFEDGRLTRCAIEKVQRRPDGTVTCSLYIRTETSNEDSRDQH